MSKTIDCRMLTPTREHCDETRRNEAGAVESIAHWPIYTDGKGGRFVLAGRDITLDSGEVVKSAPVGSMWNADWYKDSGLKPGPDGMWLIIKTPGGDWFVDGPSNNGNGWTREGAAPNITARPSILTANNQYHGWLTNGQLTEC